MADDRSRARVGPILPTVESGKIYSPASIASLIENMELTSDGTLRSVRDIYGTSVLCYDPFPWVIMANRVIHGIHHALLRGGERDVTLVHVGSWVLELHGWDKTWGNLYSGLPDDEKARFPTQFVTVSTGIVIVPQGGRALFYDGSICLPLGYSTVPSPPIGVGPETPSAATYANANTLGYHVDGARMNLSVTAVPHNQFGHANLGCIEQTPAGLEEAILRSSAWYGAYRWVDLWGNLSPMSLRSNPVTIQQAKIDLSVATGNSPEEKQFQLFWSGIANGPEGTLGKVFCRTKDTKQMGTTDLFEFPAYSNLNPAYNMSGQVEALPDNVSDGDLVRVPEDVVPVPMFKLACYAFGRLWIANADDDPGMLRASMPGRWGTFLSKDLYYPDTGGNEITGLYRCKDGLLVLTVRSTYLIVQTDDGQSFRATTIDSLKGCVAPSSIQALPDGSVIWLGQGSWMLFSEKRLKQISYYGYAEEGKSGSNDAGAIQRVVAGIEDQIERINWPRALMACSVFDPKSSQYMCWVPIDGAMWNTRRFVFDGSGFRHVNQVADSACVTTDHRSYLLIGASAPHPPTLGTAVYVLNHAGRVSSHSRRFRTSWLRVSGTDRVTLLSVNLWLRETSIVLPITLRIDRDGRKEVTSPDQAVINPVPPEYPPTLIGTAKFDQSEWHKRKDFWIKQDMNVSSCESFRMELSTLGDMELIGIQFEIGPRPGSGRVPRST